MRTLNFCTQNQSIYMVLTLEFDLSTVNKRQLPVTYIPPMSHCFWVTFKDFLAMCVPVFLKDLYVCLSLSLLKPNTASHLSPLSRSVLHNNVASLSLDFSWNYHAFVHPHRHMLNFDILSLKIILLMLINVYIMGIYGLWY